MERPDSYMYVSREYNGFFHLQKKGKNYSDVLQIIYRFILQRMVFVLSLHKRKKNRK